jgi:hypothetical protein
MSPGAGCHVLDARCCAGCTVPSAWVRGARVPRARVPGAQRHGTGVAQRHAWPALSDTRILSPGSLPTISSGRFMLWWTERLRVTTGASPSRSETPRRRRRVTCRRALAVFAIPSSRAIRGSPKRRSPKPTTISATVSIAVTGRRATRNRYAGSPTARSARACD